MKFGDSIIRGGTPIRSADNFGSDEFSYPFEVLSRHHWHVILCVHSFKRNHVTRRRIQNDEFCHSHETLLLFQRIPDSTADFRKPVNTRRVADTAVCGGHDDVLPCPHFTAVCCL